MTVLDRFRLDGKVAIVTGGNRGIGFGIAQAFAEVGATVLIAARDEERNAKAIAELKRSGDVTAVRTDVTSRKDLEALRAQTIDRHGRIDILVNNAGIGAHASALTMAEDEWTRVMRTNLDAVFTASQVIGQAMADARRGSIVNIGSMSGLIVNRPQWHSPYAVSKAGVHHLTKSLAAEWAPLGVRVNALAPGYVKTEIADIDLPEYRHYWVDEVPMQRYASVDEIAPAALYLASDASTFTTGTVLVVDGGYTLW